jgi:hypothetical protein
MKKAYMNINEFGTILLTADGGFHYLPFWVGC